MSKPSVQPTVHIIGNLPRVFIGLAFVNFLAGATLGGWMASIPSSWGVVGLIHGEINPFGWLTTLIYGMTYAVLSVSAGLRPPKAWIGWCHCAVSEVAIILVTLAYATNHLSLMRVGLAFQFAAPMLFLINILTAVASKRRRQNEITLSERDHRDTLDVLRRGPAYKDTDGVAQRGTDVSLMLFILGAFWMFVYTLIHRTPPLEQDMPRGALFLVYYGWIGGTILSVALHLFPRFVGANLFGGKAATTIQMVWGTGVFLGAVGTLGVPIVAGFGDRLLGAAFAAYALMHLTALFKYHRGEESNFQIELKSSALVAWWASWFSCFVLGIGLVFGLNPLSLLALHLFFLAFATHLVYGVGYTLFPLLLHVSIPFQVLPLAQVITAIGGVLLMALAFYGMQTAMVPNPLTLLCIGGVAAATSALVFLLQWPFARRIPQSPS